MAATRVRDELVDRLLAESEQARVEPEISELERQSPLWQKLRKIVDQRVAQLRERNDADRDDEKTAKLRGRIAECKWFLGLDRKPEKQSPDTSD